MAPPESKRLPDLMLSGDAREDYKRFDDYIRSQRLDRDGILLTGIDGENFEKVLEYGIHEIRRRTIFCFTRPECKPEIMHHPLWFAKLHMKCAIAVYDGNCLVRTDTYGYELKSGRTFRDALIGVICVQFAQMDE